MALLDPGTPLKMSVTVIAAAAILFGSFVCRAADINFTTPSGIQVKIIEAPFDPSQFKVNGCTVQTDHCLINEHPPFGVIFPSLPKTYVKSISISYKGKTYALDAADMYDAWGNHPTGTPVAGPRYFGGNCFDDKNCQLRGIFSDAAGSFVAEWKIVNGVSVRTVLTDSDDMKDLFIKHIDPPEYE